MEDQMHTHAKKVTRNIYMNYAHSKIKKSVSKSIAIIPRDSFTDLNRALDQCAAPLIVQPSHIVLLYVAF